MKTEPIGVMAGVGAVVTWALHTYVPDMPPEIVSAVGVLIVAVARQFVSPVKGREG